MKFKVTIEVDVNVDGWRDEYHHNSSAEALEDVLRQLRLPEQYFQQPGWDGFASVKSVSALFYL